MSNTPSLTPSEDLYWRLHGLSKILEGSGLIDESQHPDAYSTILDAMTFVRGQQPVVREPELDQFLSDVMTAAGLVTHGKQCKQLGERLGAAVMKLRVHNIPQKGCD